MKYFNKKYLSIGIILFIFSTLFLISINLGEAKITDWNTELDSGAGNTGIYETQGEGAADEQLAKYLGPLLGWTGFLGLVFMIHFMISAYTWMTAQGNAEKIEESKKRMKSVLIGSVILLSLYAIAYFFIKALSSATGYNVGS